MPFHDFDAARRERDQQRDPISFKYGGDKFAVHGSPPLGAVFDLADMRDTNNVVALRKLVDFVCAYLPEEDHERFRAAVRGTPSEPADAEQLYELVRWISVQHLNRPTSPSGDSSDGQQSTGSASRSTGSNGDSGSKTFRSGKGSGGSKAGSGRASTRSTSKTSKTG